MKINYTNTIFLIVTPIAAILGTTYWAYSGAFNWSTLAFGLFYLVISGLSITVGYHRLFSHKSFEAAYPVKLVLTLLGASMFEGSVLDWATDHRAHHRYTDTDKDPYNFTRGFWYAHIGWLFLLESSSRDFSNVKDLLADKLMAWQDKHYKKIATFMGFLLPMMITSIWGDPLGGLFIAGALRITLNQHFTFCINSICHCIGKSTYDDRGTARDHWFTALLTYGEGYHNFHHKFPLDYRNGIRVYDFDPSKWVIRLLSMVGLASNLKWISQRRIIQCRMEMQEKLLRDKLNSPTVFADRIIPLVEQAKASVLNALTKLEKIENNIKSLKEKRIESVNLRIKIFQQHAKNIRRELRVSMKEWTELVNGNLFADNHIQG